MKNLNNAVSALAIGLLVVGLASSSATAQVSKPAGWTPGQAYVVTISTSSGIPLMVVHAGRIPLASEPRVALFLPDLDDGEQELRYALSMLPDPGLSGSANKKSQEIVGRLHKVFVKANAGAILGSGAQGGQAKNAVGQGGSVLVLSGSGMQVSSGHDLSDDIVWNDPCVFGGIQVSSPPASEAGAASLGSAGDGVLKGSGAGAKNISGSLGGPNKN